MKKVVILGSGIEGLSVAWQISLLRQFDIALYEKRDDIGGLCGFYNFDGLKLDYGPHKIYSVNPELMEVFKDVGGERVVEIKKKQGIILRDRQLDYPIKLRQLLSIFTFTEIIGMGLSAFVALSTPPFLKKKISYEDYCQGLFGKKIYNLVFRPLAEKAWGDPKNLSAYIARRRIPTKSTWDLISRLLKIKKESRRTNAEVILYPRLGFYDICKAMAEEIEKSGHKIYLGSRPVRLEINNGKIETILFDNSKEEHPDLVISTISLTELLPLLYPQEKDADEKENFVKMRHCIIVYLLIDRPRVIDNHWIFCVDKKLLFSRISEQKLLSDHGFPEDKTVICCDFSCNGKDPLWKESDKAIVEKCISGLEGLKIIKKQEIIDYRVVRLPDIYPAYEIGFESKRESLFDKINRIENIISIGRQGMYDYCNVDHCMDMAIYVARSLFSGKEPSSINRELIKRTGAYYIVD